MDKLFEGFDHTSALPQVKRVPALRPFAWLRSGWDDIRHNPTPSIAHGVLLATFGWMVLLICSTHIDLIAAALCGFLLLGPVAGAAFYELARLRAAGQPVTFEASVDGALKRRRSLVHLGLLLAMLVIAWALTSVLLFEGAFGGALPSVSESPWRTIFEWHYSGFFVTYIISGAVFALLAFALSAVAAPMLLDRRVDTKTAVLTSVKAVGVNPAAMAVWAASVAVLTAIGFATFLLAWWLFCRFSATRRGMLIVISLFERWPISLTELS